MQKTTKKINKPTESLYQNGKWQCKNLAFLVEFMKTAGLTTQKMATLTGYSRQCIFFWLKTDNASLKKLQKVFNTLGYELSFELTKEQETRKNSTTIITLAEPKSKTCANLNTCERLMFLVKAMAKYNFNIMDIVKTTGMTRTSVAHWFDIDDLMVGHIFTVAEKFGLEVTTRICPCEQTKTAQA